jgi:mitochondrial import inner membrane translocase subunit TIM22
MIENPLLAPLFPVGKGPLPPGMTEEDRANMMQMKKYQDNMTAGMESCVGKTTVAGAFGTSALTSFLPYFPSTFS